MARREYDVVMEDGEFIDTVMVNLTEDLAVDYMVTSMNGPSGWPMVTVAGAEADLLIFELRYNGDLQPA